MKPHDYISGLMRYSVQRWIQVGSPAEEKRRDEPRTQAAPCVAGGPPTSPPPAIRAGALTRTPRFRHLLALLLLAAIAVSLIVVLYDATPASAEEPRAGDLDRTFSGDGRVTTDFGDNFNRIHNRAHAVAVQPDGKIVAAGYAANDFALTRYNANGTLDTSFGAGGKVRTAFGGGEDRANAMTIQSDGKIVVAGYANIAGGNGRDFAVARYNANGALDTSFSGDGKVTTHIHDGNDKANAVAIDSNGKIVVAGSSLNIISVVRYNADGTLDTGFSSDGKLTTQIGGSTSVDLANAVAVQSDNKIVVAGISNSDPALVRYNNDGSLDTTFGSGGKVTTSRSTFSTSTQRVEFNSIVIQSDGKIVAAGDEFAGSDQDFALARYHANGTLDTSFGSGGTVVTDFGNTEDFAHSVALQANGKILVAGFSGVDSTDPYLLLERSNFALARYTSAGLLDGRFGSGGKVITDFGHNDYGRAMAIQADGNIVVAGYTLRGIYQDFAVARYLGRGAPSKDASLSVLAVHQGPNANVLAGLAPFRPLTFNQHRTGYTALLAAGTTHVKVIPTAGDVNATIFVTGGGQRQQVVSGRSSTAIPVAGFSRIVVEVTAEDGKNRQTYTINLRPAANEASLSNLEAQFIVGYQWEPLVIGEFNPERTSYSAVVPYSTGSEAFGQALAVWVTATLDLTTSTMTVNGEAATSGILTEIPLEVGDNVITVRVTAGDGVTTRDYTLTVKRLTPDVSDWRPALKAKDLGGKRGCQNGVNGSECSDSAVLSESRFKVHVSDAQTTSYRVEELSSEKLQEHWRNAQYRVVLTVSADHQVRLNDMALVITFRGDELRLPFYRAKRSGHGETFTWLEWARSTHNTEPIALKWETSSVSDVGVRLDSAKTGLNTVRVYYDEIRDGRAVEGFRHWDIALEKPYDAFYHDDWDGDRAHIAVIPGEFPGHNSGQGKLTTTHARLRLSAATPGSTIRYLKGAYDHSPPPFAGFYTALPSSGLTEPIELDPASKYTYVWVMVSDRIQGVEGHQQQIHLVIIDPPPRTYKLDPEATVTEGQEATLTVSLGSPATRGGVTFNVSAAYGAGGATADDVGEIVSSVTVPEGLQSATITVPTVDDDAVEEDESFSVSISHVGSPAWAEDPQGTATATITIENDDEPPEGPEPWNVKVVPGDGTLTVTWRVASRDGYEDSEIWHALRWSQQFGVWANPRDWRAVGRNDGLSVDPGVTSYTITGLKNGVATGVWIRSMVGYRSNMSERDAASSQWVRTKGVHTTPVAPAGAGPRLANPIADASIANERGTRRVPLAGVFTVGGGDLTITASSSNQAVATVAASADGSSLTVTARARGTAQITVTASDGEREASDTFTVTVKTAPRVASAVADIGSLATGTSLEVALSRVFADADNDTLRLSASSSATAVATVSLASGGSSLTVTGVAEGKATITVTARDSDGNQVADTFGVTVTPPPNQAPTVASAISDTTIEREGGAKRVSLAGVFSDADGDDLTITAKSSAPAVAAVTVASDQSSLTVTAKKSGTATISVTADDGNDGSVSDAFTVTVATNAAPTVASPIADLSGLRVDDARRVSLAGVFSDADDDKLTITAKSSDPAVATVSVATDQSSLTVTAKQSGAATITVTADDGNGETVSDSFTATVQANNSPTVAAAITDVSGLRADDTRRISLSGVFTDDDGDALTITATSSDTAVATVSVAAGQSSLTLTAKQAGTATITVGADDGNQGTVSDSFTVTVAANSAPTVASALGAISELREGGTHQVSLAGVFSDADNDALTISAGSSNDGVATATVNAGGGSLTVTAKQAGTATITVTADDGNGGRTSTTFTVTVEAEPEPQPEPQPEPEAETPASSSTQEQDVVARYDANKDGVISYSEYLAAVADIGKGVTYADLVLIRQAWVDGGYKR